MGGKINVQSNVGEGSIFMVNLPQKIGKMYDDIKQLRRLQVVLIFTYNEETEIEDKIKDAPTYIFGADSIEDIYIIGD